MINFLGYNGLNPSRRGAGISTLPNQTSLEGGCQSKGWGHGKGKIPSALIWCPRVGKATKERLVRWNKPRCPGGAPYRISGYPFPGSVPQKGSDLVYSFLPGQHFGNSPEHD